MYFALGAAAFAAWVLGAGMFAIDAPRVGGVLIALGCVLEVSARYIRRRDER